MGSSLLIATVVCGVIFGVITTVVLFFLWRYINKKSQLEKGEDVIQNESFLPTDGEQRKLSTFQIPKPYKSVKQQLASRDDDTRLLPKLTLTNTDRERSQTMGELLLNNEHTEYHPHRKYSALPSPNTKRQQRRTGITDKMFLNLKGLRKKDGNGSSDDNISVSSLDFSANEGSVCEEEFDTPTAGAVRKRKVGKRRLLETTATTQQQQRSFSVAYRKDGKLEFSSEYQVTEQTLIIQMIALKHIALKRDINTLSPYIRVYLDPGKKQKQESKYVKHKRDVVLNEAFQFHNISLEDFDKYKLKVKVLNHSKFRTSEVLGEVEMNLFSLNPKCKETFSVDLFVKRSESSLSSVLIGLCHEPSFSKLVVRIEEAKHLPKGTHSHHNPYATVALYTDTSEERKNTVAIRHTRDPHFEEQLDFYLITDFETPITTFSLVVTIMNHTLIGQDEVLGHVIFSLASPTQSALEQWQKLEKEPYKLINEWHSMIGPDEI